MPRHSGNKLAEAKGTKQMWYLNASISSAVRCRGPLLTTGVFAEQWSWATHLSAGPPGPSPGHCTLLICWQKGDGLCEQRMTTLVLHSLFPTTSLCLLEFRKCEDSASPPGWMLNGIQMIQKSHLIGRRLKSGGNYCNNFLTLTFDLELFIITDESFSFLANQGLGPLWLSLKQIVADYMGTLPHNPFPPLAKQSEA